MKATFGSKEFKHVEGYYIGACWGDQTGFNGRFYVCFLDRVDASFEMDPKDAFYEEEQQGPSVDKLQVNAQERVYVFDEIQLTSVQVAVTRRQKLRMFEFAYPLSHMRQWELPVTLDNKVTEQIRKGSLKEGYTFSIGDDTKELLGFETLLVPNSAVVVRFATLRNNNNSFLQKILDINQSGAQNEKWEGFTINFAQKNFEISHETTQRIYYNEYTHVLRKWDLPQLDRMGQPPDSDYGVRIGRTSGSADRLLRHWEDPRYQARNVMGQAVEIATIVFKQGKYQDLAIK
jgi:hypothetical protein